MTGPLIRTADHRYRLGDGDWVPGVTSAIREIAKPALIPWAMGKTADAAINHFDRFAEILTTDGRPPARGWLIGHADQERDSAASLGSGVHTLTEKFDRAVQDVKVANPTNAMKFEDFAADFIGADRDTIPYIDAYRRYLEDWHPVIKSLEQFVYNAAEGYGGTYDAIEVLTLPSGVTATTLRDTKTGKGVYAETRLQLTALARPENIIGRADTDKTWKMPAIDFGTILHLRPDAYERGYQLYRIDPNAADWAAFRGALAIYRWRQQRPTSGEPLQNGVTP